MCARRPGHTVRGMTSKRLLPLLGALAVAAVGLAVLLPSDSPAAGKTVTLKFFAKPVKMTYTRADGTVAKQPPGTPEPIRDVYIKAFTAAVNDPQFKTEWSKLDPDSPNANHTELESLVNEIGQVSPEALGFIQQELARQGIETTSQ